MTSAKQRPARRLIPAGLLVGSVLATAAITLPSGPVRPQLAQAHTSVASTRPASGATAKPNITLVVMIFKGGTRSNRITVIGPGAKVVSKGSSRDPRNPKRYQALLKQPLKAGSYTARWNMTAADGHKQTGSWTFKVKK